MPGIFEERHARSSNYVFSRMNAIAILVRWLFHLFTSGMHLLTTSCLTGLKTGAGYSHQIVATEFTDQPIAGHTM
jgi:ABC-type uncharacterized transport system permease subunit